MAMADILGGMNTPEMWRQMLLHMQRGGTAIDPNQTYGFSNRNIAGTNRPSMHSYRDSQGRPASQALDVNADANPEGASATRGALPFDMYGEAARKPQLALDRGIIEDVQNRFPVKNLMDRSTGPDRMHFQYDPTNPARFIPTGPAPMNADWFNAGTPAAPLGMPGVGVGGMGIDPGEAFRTNQRLGAPPGGDQPIEDMTTLFPGSGAGPPPAGPQGLDPLWRDPSGVAPADLRTDFGPGPDLTPPPPPPGPTYAPGTSAEFPYGKPEGDFAAPPASDTAARPTSSASGGPAPAVAGGGIASALENLPRTGILGAIGNAAGMPVLTSAAKGIGGMLNDPVLLAALGFWGGGPAGASALGGIGTSMQGNQYKGQELEIEREKLAIAQQKAREEGITFGQSQKEYENRQRIWKEVFGSTGVPNEGHPLLKDVPPEYAQTAYAMGPDAGLVALRDYQLANAKQKLELRKMMQLQQQSLERFGMGGTPATPGAAAGVTSSPPAGPSAAPAAPTPAFGGTDIGGTIPFAKSAPVAPTPAPLAPAPPSPGAAPAPAPTPAPPAPGGIIQGATPLPGGINVDPMIRIGNAQIPLRYARAYAAADEAAGIKDGVWSKAIASAEAPVIAAQTEKAKMDVAQEQQKPQARLAATNMADKLNSTEALSEKILNNPRLTYATGFLGSRGPGGVPRPFASVRLNTDTNALEADIDTLIAKVGLDTLAAMREGSKTGSSGLGGTSDNEINMLSNSLTALKDTSISEPAYRQNLQTVIDVVRSVRSRMQSTWKETYGEDFKPAGELTNYPRKSPAQIQAEETKAERAARKAATRSPNDKMKQGGWSVEKVE
jgi:hypothetical protein